MDELRVTDAEHAVFDKLNELTERRLQFNKRSQSDSVININYPESDYNSRTKWHRQGTLPSIFETQEEDHLSWRQFHTSKSKLKATATSSKILAAFAMSVMIEIQLNSPSDTDIPDWLFITFTVTTSLLASVNIFALMVSTCILPTMDVVEEAELISESPHDRLKNCIEMATILSSVLGLFLFLIEIALLCWVKFWDFSFTACLLPTLVVIPVIVIFISMVIHFYRTLVFIKYKSTVNTIRQLDEIRKSLSCEI